MRRQSLYALAGLIFLLGMLLTGIGVTLDARQPRARRAASAPAPTRTVARPDDFGLPDGSVMYNGPIAFAFDAHACNPAWTMHVVTSNWRHGSAVRSDRFFADMRIPAAYRATNEDFKGSGLDRGHFAPEGDFSLQADRDVSCCLSNVGLQNSDLNQHYWAKRIETAVRELAVDDVVLYVFTGLVYPRDETGAFVVETIGPHHLWKPSKWAKGVLVTRNGQPLGTRAWLVPNEAIPHDTLEETYRVSVDQLELETRRDVFSGLPDEIEDRMEAVR